MYCMKLVQRKPVKVNAIEIARCKQVLIQIVTKLLVDARALYGSPNVVKHPCRLDPPLGPISFIVVQFWEKFGQIIGWPPPPPTLGVGTPVMEIVNLPL